MLFGYFRSSKFVVLFEIKESNRKLFMLDKQALKLDS